MRFGDGLIVTRAEQNILNVTAGIGWICCPYTRIWQCVLSWKIKLLLGPVTVETRSGLRTENVISGYDFSQEWYKWTTLLNHTQARLKQRHCY
jgi:hypothetical protein